MDTEEQLRRGLLECMARAGITTRTALARKAKLQRRTLDLGPRTKVETLERIAKALGCHPRDLWGVEQNGVG